MSIYRLQGNVIDRRVDVQTGITFNSNVVGLDMLYFDSANSNVIISNTALATTVRTDNLLYINGDPYWFNTYSNANVANYMPVYGGDILANNIVTNGNLTVLGNTLFVNSTTVLIADVNLVLAKNANTAAEADGAGITVNGANATITYSAATDTWNFNKPVNLPAANIANLTFTNTTVSTSLTDGNLTLTPTGANSMVLVNAVSALGLPAGTTVQQPYLPPVGALRYNTDIVGLEYYTGTNWVALISTDIDFETLPYANTNVYTLKNSVATDYSVLVILNGVTQTPGNAYTTSGNTLTWNPAALEQPQEGDTLEVRYLTSSVTYIDTVANPTPITVSSNTAVDAFNVGEFSTVKYIVQGKNTDTGDFQSTEALLVSTNTDTFLSTYANVCTNGGLFTLSSNISSGQVNLVATKLTANCDIKIHKIYITA